MLPLLVTVLATAYFVVPDLLYRFVFGLFLIRKVMNAPRNEELMHGAFWSLIPLSLAWTTRRWLTFRFPASVGVATQQVFSCLHNDKIFEISRPNFFSAFEVFTAANFALLARVYLFVVVCSVGLGLMARNFGNLRLKAKPHPRISKALHAIVLPRISEWHFALSSMLLADPQQYCVSVDVRLKGGLLYRGNVSEKKIASDGTLQTLILSSVQRFLQPDFDRDLLKFEAKGTQRKISPSQKPDSDLYWRRIPGELFVIVGSDISTVNVRHVSTVSSTKPNEDAELKGLLREVHVLLNKQLEQ